jgi:hypothetical protein
LALVVWVFTIRVEENTMTSKESNDSVLAQVADELKLQAHLARMERTEPSEHEPGIHKEASALARMRDRFRLQIHLGEMEAKDEWHEVEERWRHFIQRTVRPAAKDLADGAEETTNDLLRKIREGYKRLIPS